MSATPSAMASASQRGGPARPAGPGCRRAGAGRAPRVGQQHQRQQPGDLAVVGQQPVQLAGQPDRLGGQLGPLQVGPGAGGVALVEDQVEDVEHDPQALRPLVRRRHGEPGPGGLDGLLGPADALGHRRLRDEERAGDLGGGQAADGPQRQRDLRGRRQRRMAAQEQQRQGVVSAAGRSSSGAGGDQLVGRRGGGDGLLPAAAGRLAADLVGQPPRGDRDQPAARAVGDAARRATGRRRPAAPPGPRPRTRRTGRSAGPARRGPAAPAPAAGPRPRRRRHISRPGLVHQRPDLDGGVRGTAAPAISIARSMLSTSITQRPASSSLASLNGPSVTAGTPSRRPIVLRWCRRRGRRREGSRPTP